MSSQQTSAKRIPDALWVYSPDGLVGTLHNSDPLSFSYSETWLATPGAKPIVPALPLTPDQVATPAVAAFFENLLPEGDQRKVISIREKVSTVFGLLSRVGGESAGAFVLVPQGEILQPPVYQHLTWDQVDLLVHADVAQSAEREEIEREAAALPAPRMSISGAQFKLLLYVDEKGNPARPMGNAPSTHILKPDIQRSDIKVFASSVNETIIMLAADKCGLQTAKVAYQPNTRACLVERYDRERQPDGSLKRIWQADFCQMLEKPSDVKYEAEGGPTFKDCYDLLEVSALPAVDRLQLLRWLFFNLCAGNDDSHAKNLSIIATPKGLRLAPFYDLMCTRVYPGLAAKFAFEIAGETEPGKITEAHIHDLAHTLGVAPKYMASLARDMARRVPAATSAAAEQLLPALGPQETVMAERLVQRISSISARLDKRITEGPAQSDETAPEEEPSQTPGP
ncbi:type II toxin-antitoxin system HipA family toxin [Massilia varians]|uniref:type II toxin-antitoxin system HipA family toxin n=1 Tax=Massilia TaxID=149698 RepID=UPI002553E43B|nr:type II toxin-antitoxin system HipA family toxin [Massilia varians]